jgi:hypothetical protein
MEDLLWIGIIVIFGTLVMSVFVVAYVWLTPVIPYIRAKMDGKDLVFMLGKDNKMRLVPAKYSSSVYSTAKFPYSFIQREPRSFRFGDLQAVFVLDNWGVIIDPLMVEALKELEKIGISNYEELEYAMKMWAEDEKANVPYERRRGLDPASKIAVHAFTDIDLQKLYDYIGNVTPSEIRAHLDEKIAIIVEEYRDLGGKKEGGTNWILIISIIGLIGIGAAGAKMLGFF